MAAFGGIDHFHKTYAPLKMRAEVRVGLAVLRFWARANAIGQDGLESIKICAHNVHVVIYHDAGQVLTHALAHDARLSVMYRESFFMHDGRHVGGEAGRTFLEGLTAGESQIVSVP